MRIFVKVKAKAREDRIEKKDDSHFDVWVKEPPVAGRANRAVLRRVGECFRVPPARMKIVSGLASRQKIIEL
ncbi:MAG: DUF167 domain-containing protein [Candidatus Nealsonbacteria bacterium]|nr:DUF167 domain-containing protein [Candidatus Nealsonbacteria bacterium]